MRNKFLAAIDQPPERFGQVPFERFNIAIGLKGDFTTLGAVINSFVPILFTIAGFLLLIYLLWGGFSYMLSRGDPKAIESARAKITTALIGFVIIFVAFWLVQLLGLVFGIEQFRAIF